MMKDRKRCFAQRKDAFCFCKISVRQGEKRACVYVARGKQECLREHVLETESKCVCVGGGNRIYV